jgi:IMP and pyridine-specific 5'-nucleotidase
VWVDVGNKLIGVQVMQKWLGAGPGETLHVGDQFLGTGALLQSLSAVQLEWSGVEWIGWVPTELGV